MSSHQYRPTNSGEADGDSDADLSLDELDPIATSSFPPPRSSRISNGQKRTWGGKVHVEKFRLGGLRHGNVDSPDSHDEQEGGNEDNDEELHQYGSRSAESARSFNIGEDDAPLLQQNAQGGELRPRLQSSRSKSRTSTLSNFLAKMRSTPRSEVENEHDSASNRTVAVGHRQSSRYPPNVVSNAKYTPWSFLPRTLYNEFSFFLNMYFLLVALSQIIKPLRIGVMSTYIAPLVFVIVISLGKEAFDDLGRRRRDAEANSERYEVLSFNDLYPTSGKKKRVKKTRRTSSISLSRSRLDDIEEEEQHLNSNGSTIRPASVSEITKAARDLRVGDVLRLRKDQRVPADVILLKGLPNDAEHGVDNGETGESSLGSTANATKPQDSVEAFIRTDQLDGETDWKLRLAPALSQTLEFGELSNLQIIAGKPDRNVNDFVGTIRLTKSRSNGSTLENASAPLTIDNTAWANTVLASSNHVLAVILYTGPQTRQALSTAPSRTKTGLLELEINSLTKILCMLTLTLSFVLVALEKFEPPNGHKWYVAVMRFLILFSTIVPISLRVNLDLGKSVYAWFIQHDEDIPGTIVRTSTIPEDLGRIEYLLTDKTGTLTQNDMQLKKVHVGTVSYAGDAMTEVSTYIRQAFGSSALIQGSPSHLKTSFAPTATRSRREIGSRVCDLVLALALCHNVTPTVADEDGGSTITYQASSPDEIAIVRWTESVGLRLVHRDRHSMVLESVNTGQPVIQVEILSLFPFTSEGKRMGVILKFTPTTDSSAPSASDEQEPIWFFQKGADTVMGNIVTANDWLEEETANMAREGLRTLVVGRKKLSQHQYADFAENFKSASISLSGRDAAMSKVVAKYLEHDLELLGVTGVEDKLQHDVKPSLELLRNAGIKVWMLTGDKVETARCVAVSSKLVARGQYVHTIAKMTRKDLAKESLDFLRSKPDACLLVDGESLSLLLTHHRGAFIEMAVRLSAVIACRCSPMQKAEIASLIRSYTKKRICCIGDGGNDVSMIQAADVGVGIVGKEGRQASLAADFSITQFHHLTKLLVWHGRNSYKRSAKLAQFVIHRGLIISVCQTVFSIADHLAAEALYKDWLLVGYATIYTAFPVFSLTLDTDIPAQLAHLYPELYAELSSSRSLSYRTFFIWVAISVYQGCAIQILSHVLVGFDRFKPMVSVSFTVLIINELVMVAAEITTYHWIMIATIVGTGLIYFGSIPFLGEYFGNLDYVVTIGFWWRVIAIAAVSLVPVYGAKILRRTIRPPNYRKVQQGL